MRRLASFSSKLLLLWLKEAAERGKSIQRWRLDCLEPNSLVIARPKRTARECLRSLSGTKRAKRYQQARLERLFWIARHFIQRRGARMAAPPASMGANGLREAKKATH